MAANHGNRVYVQVLLGQYRGELFLKDAEDAGMKPSAWMRELIYDYLRKKYPEQEAEAEEQEKELWKEAVRSRLEARALRRKAVLLALKQIQSED
jgi:hypothetical protein